MRSTRLSAAALFLVSVSVLGGCAKAHPGSATPAAQAAAAAPSPDSAPDARTGGSGRGREVLTSRASDRDGVAATASAAVAQFRAEADAAFTDPSVNALWAVEVQSLDTSELLYARNAHALVMPASNMKIVTMSVAATRLGWDYRFDTTLETTGRVSGGVLQDDLTVVGSGDPTTSDRGGAATRVFESWADQLLAAGITRIDGRIIGDDNRFDDRPLGDGWAWDDMAFSYSAPGGALQFNENIVRIIVTPAATPGQPATVRLDPEGSGLTVRSAVTTGAPTLDANVDLSRQLNSTTVYLTGIVPATGKETMLSATVDNPTIFFVNALRSTLIRKGIAVTGAAVDIDDIPTPAPTPRRVLLTHQSPPLSEIGTTFMKVSQNLFGETLMTLIGARAAEADGSGTPAAVPALTTPSGSNASGGNASGRVAGSAQASGSASASDGFPVNHHHYEAARKVYEQMLGSWGVPKSEFVLVDGSGLSRYNFVTPHMLVRILKRMARDPKLGPPFEATLPIGGKDGTLGPRMKGTKSENNVHAKTGSLANVRALSGYVRTADGERIVFSIIANNFNVPTAAVDAITDQIVERLANFTRKP
jgi:D-alanyl-D-alanine carboxypeptidase/D-alanyl-D-alanine-endopeptidase (penicillin-binding protein 4)